jgi:hypothetical protein
VWQYRALSPRQTHPSFEIWNVGAEHRHGWPPCEAGLQSLAPPEVKLRPWLPRFQHKWYHWHKPSSMAQCPCIKKHHYQKDSPRASRCLLGDGQGPNFFGMCKIWTTLTCWLNPLLQNMLLQIRIYFPSRERESQGWTSEGILGGNHIGMLIWMRAVSS